MDIGLKTLEGNLGVINIKVLVARLKRADSQYRYTLSSISR